ncbi:Terpene synthase, N-terminal domain [Dillenia turbinata]|uniref:Terpene synthase, N-terminal domain n=1 Tax=Dillenia turbinata TaxID=194707 RepID=A0AAN8VI98_9MAGN
MSSSMSLHHTERLLQIQKPLSGNSKPNMSASLGIGVKIATETKTNVLNADGAKERIKRMFDKVELSVSAYDTAWVAMIPSPISNHAPYFPGCLEWLLENQLQDGSWGLPHHHPLLIKDALSSTLACVLALKRWGVGKGHIQRGLHFVASNFASATDGKQHSPIGFDIIFPGMVERARDLNLVLPLRLEELEPVLQNRDLELKRCHQSNSRGSKAYLAYVSEGMGKFNDWESVMSHQRKNGSLFNSPSTTAAAFAHLHDSGCINYLHSVIEKFGNAVPTIYPLDAYGRLCIVDNLGKMGLDRHFSKEIKSVLDETYRCWLQEDEEIFLDIVTCAMAFRVLRANGYNVSPDPLTHFAEENQYLDSLTGRSKDTDAVLELFKASQFVVYPEDAALEKQNSWSSQFLEQELSNGSIQASKLNEVYNVLNFPYHASLDRLVNRINLEHFEANFLSLGVDDFNMCQSIQRQELKHLERWVIENRLDRLKFARQKLAYCYFSAAATLFSPELSDARISWAKNGVLTTVVDDFYDLGGSEDELQNLIQLIERWDVDPGASFCSQSVEIIFKALHSTITEIGEKAFKYQERCVKKHVAEIWLDLIKSMMTEAKWVEGKHVPTMEEYMTNGYVSFALGPIILPALYFVGPKLSEEAVRSAEYHNLYKHVSTCGRLLNDMRSFEREAKEGKLNAVLLSLIHSAAALSEEDSIKEIKGLIEQERRKLLRMVLQTKGSVIPRECKDLFWKMSQILHSFYAKDDGFTSPDEMVGAINSVIFNPIELK